MSDFFAITGNVFIDAFFAACWLYNIIYIFLPIERIWRK